MIIVRDEIVIAAVPVVGVATSLTGGGDLVSTWTMK